MIKKAIAIALCISILCISIATAATNVSLSDAKNGVNIHEDSSNNTNAEHEASNKKVISLTESAERSQNNSSSSDLDLESETVDNGNFLTNAVSSGIALFLRGMCDGIYADIYADEGNGTEFTNSTKDGIYAALTFVPNPYEDKNIVELYGGYLNITIFCILVFVFGALISRSIARMKLAKNVNLAQSAFVGGIATCGFALIANILYAGVLSTIEALNKFITLPAMPALTPDPNNLLLFIIQTCCDLVLFVFFDIRYYIIYITAVGCSVIAVLLVPEFTRDFAKNCIEKITRILFLQPAALFVYVVCIISIDGMPDDLKVFAHIGTTVMVFATCWYFMFGNFTLLKKGISFAIRKGVVKI